VPSGWSLTETHRFYKRATKRVDEAQDRLLASMIILLACRTDETRSSGGSAGASL
jgi:hypothetical protein